MVQVLFQLERAGANITMAVFEERPPEPPSDAEDALDNLEGPAVVIVGKSQDRERPPDVQV